MGGIVVQFSANAKSPIWTLVTGFVPIGTPTNTTTASTTVL